MLEGTAVPAPAPAGYELLGPIGGGQGGAWRARRRNDEGTRVVAKYIEGDVALDESFALLRRVSSAHLPEPIELVHNAEGGAWLITHWVEGQSLKPGPAAPAQVLREALGLARALAEIHALGLHHGDVAPDNIVAHPNDGEVTLIDLGFLGQSGCGTPGFMAPEVLAGAGGPAADVFALGVVIVLRWTGTVPWKTADDLLTARDAEDVRARIDQLTRDAGIDMPRPVRALLGAMLHPHAHERPFVTGHNGLCQQLESLLLGLGGAAIIRHRRHRINYRGVELKPITQALLQTDSSIRLVLVVGPPNSGRGRIIRELVGSLQEAGRNDARLDPPQSTTHDARRPAHDSGWLGRWLDSDKGSVLGLCEALHWPNQSEHASAPASQSRVGVNVRTYAAQLATASALAQATLIIALDPETASETSRLVGDLCRCIEVRPWSPRQLRACAMEIDPSLTETQRSDALAAVQELSQGWPARAVDGLWSCAALVRRLAAEQTSVEISAGILAEHIEAHQPLPDDATARTLLERAWRAESNGSEEPTANAWNLALARQQLGERLVPLARAFVDDQPEFSPGLRLVLDADRPEDIARWVASQSHARPLPPELVAWALAQPERLSPELAAAVAKQCLANGAIQPAETLLRAHEDHGACRVLLARSLQQLGRPEAALQLLDDQLRAQSAEAQGLRWRSMADLGRAAEVVHEIDAWVQTTQTPGDARPLAPEILATNLTWAAHAYARVPDLEEGQGPKHEPRALLEQAMAILDTHAPPDAREPPPRAAARARVRLMLGNLVWASGEIDRASEHFEAATAAFAAAGEGVGRCYAQGNAAACAVPQGRFAQSVELGRDLVSRLLACGLAQPLPIAVLNLVQGLIALGTHDEADALLDAVEALQGKEATPLAQAVLQSARLELAGARLPPEPGHPVDGIARELSAAMQDNAQRLAEQASESGYIEQILAASRLARRYGWSQLSARTAAEGLRNLRKRGSARPPHHIALLLEAMTLDTTQPRSKQALPGADLVAELDQLPGRSSLIDSGLLPLAFRHAATLSLRLAHVQGRHDPEARRHATEALDILKTIIDRAPAMFSESIESHLSDAVELEALGALATSDEPIGEHPQTHRASTASPPPPMPEPAPRERARILQIYARLAQEERLDVLLGQVVEAVLELTGAERGVVVVGEGPEATQVVRETMSRTDVVEFSRSIIARVRETGEAVLTVDAARDLRFGQSRSVNHLNLRSVLAVPLIFRGRLLGAVYVDHRLRRGAFDEGHLEIAEDFANLASLAIAHADAVAGLRARAGQLEARRDELSEMLEARDLELRGLRDQVRRHEQEVPVGMYGIIGASPRLVHAMQMIERLATNATPVVIEGESGTGKELAARVMHAQGHRSAGPFVADSCTAIPAPLMESVLFGQAAPTPNHAPPGYERYPNYDPHGMATDSYGLGQPGLIEMAHGGTLFLDEVGELEPASQAKLLRALEDGCVRRLGEQQWRRVDVRIVVAHTSSLHALVKEGKFRKDLYYCLSVVRIELPPLRERREDIPALLRHFLLQRGAGDREVSGTAMRRLARYPWPGNIRELENEVMRWLALAGEKIGEADLSPEIRDSDSQQDDPDDLELKPRVTALERSLIARALRRTGGNLTQAAELLGLSRYGLQKKLRRFAADDDASSEDEPRTPELSPRGGDPLLAKEQP